MKKSRYTDSQIMSILKQAESGTPVPELCRELGMSSASFYKWRSRYGGMDAINDGSFQRTRRRKSSSQENASRGTPQSGNNPGSHGKKVVRPSQRKEMAQQVVVNRGVSIRLACNAFGISETCYRYQAIHSSENEIIADWLIKLIERDSDWGFGLCFDYLRHVKGFGWNHKRVYLLLRACIEPQN